VQVEAFEYVFQRMDADGSMQVTEEEFASYFAKSKGLSGSKAAPGSSIKSSLLRSGGGRKHHSRKTSLATLAAPRERQVYPGEPGPGGIVDEDEPSARRRAIVAPTPLKPALAGLMRRNYSETWKVPVNTPRIKGTAEPALTNAGRPLGERVGLVEELPLSRSPETLSPSRELCINISREVTPMNSSLSVTGGNRSSVGGNRSPKSGPPSSKGFGSRSPPGKLPTIVKLSEAGSRVGTATTTTMGSDMSRRTFGSKVSRRSSWRDTYGPGPATPVSGWDRQIAAEDRWFPNVQMMSLPEEEAGGAPAPAPAPASPVSPKGGNAPSWQADYHASDKGRVSVDVQLPPEEEYVSRFRFTGTGPSEAAMDKMISQMTTGTLSSWQAAEGSRVGDGLFGTFVLPDGRSLRLYHNSQKRNCREPTPEPPDVAPNKLSVLQGTTVCKVHHPCAGCNTHDVPAGHVCFSCHPKGCRFDGDISKGHVCFDCRKAPYCPTIYFETLPPRPIPPYPTKRDVPQLAQSVFLGAPQPHMHTLPVRNQDVWYGTIELDAMQFGAKVVIPAPPKIIEKAVEKAGPPKCPVCYRFSPCDVMFDIDDSVFTPRKKWSDSRSYYSSKKVRLRGMDLDWSRTNTERFRKFIGKEDDAADPTETDKELEELKHVLMENVVHLQQCFSYYCCVKERSYDSFCMGLLAYTEMLMELDYQDDVNGFCKKRDIDLVFITVNVEDKSSEKTADEKLKDKMNADTALMRFEFLQAVVRLAINKYIKVSPGGAPQVTNDVSDALSMYIDRMRKLHPKESWHDPDVFRRNRLYRLHVNDIFERHETWLKELYKFYSNTGSDAKDMTAGKSGILLSLDEWTNFVLDVGLVDTEVTERELSLCFIWSQTFVSDEIKRREKMIHCMHVDFFEALARICCFKALPTDAQMEKVGATTCKQYFDAVAEGLVEGEDRLKVLNYEEEEASEEDLAIPLEKLLNLIFERFDRDGDGKFGKDDFRGRGQGVATARTVSEGLAQAKTGNKKAQQAGAGRG